MSAVLVTGATAGIGLATARLLLAEGRPVVAVDLDPAPLEGDAVSIRADLSDPAGVERAAAEALAAQPDISGLVNCAGIYPVTPMLEMTAAEWDAVLGLNLRAPFLLTQALARRWRQTGAGGVVVNVASTAMTLARPGVAHYAASKAGLAQLTRVMAVELAPLGVRVNAETLRTQLDMSGQLDFLALPYHRQIMNGEIPLSIGGGIGQSRVYMYLLRKAHLGEVSVTVWPRILKEMCRAKNIRVLE